MPIHPSDYRPPLLFRNGHIATIYAGLFRRINGLEQKRERVLLPDGDFLDLDWSFASKPDEKVVILLHGLEGHGQRPYITGSARSFLQAGFDVCAVNFRGCSGETNKLFRSYHSGATEDLDAVVNHIISLNKYSRVFVKGFSLGGNMVLKYLGEGRRIPNELKGVVAVSVPCDLHDSLIQLLKPKNILYARRFRRHLVEKLWAKHQLYPEQISVKEIRSIKNLKDFDDVYTSKAHGFSDALDYYRKCSCRQFLKDVEIPSLIINAKNDSFLGKNCYPEEEANENKNIILRMPAYGGHVGFYGGNNVSYTEKVAVKFLEEMS